MSQFPSAYRLGRRDFLQAGVLGLGGMSLASILRAESTAAAPQSAKTSSVILVHLAGGPSHLDSFDPKPDAPDEIRSEFQTIETAIAGHRISEHLPGLAKMADKYSLLRGVSHNLAAHDLGQRYVLSGSRPQAGIEYPAMGAVVSKELKVPAELPPYVAIPKANVSPGYLGVAYSPFDTNAIPAPNRPFVVRGLANAANTTKQLQGRRFELLKTLDRRFGPSKAEDQLVAGLDQFSQKAFDILQSSRTREAFNIDKESAAVRKNFGGSQLGSSCLLDARLVEAGVRFVHITNGGWDTHVDNFNKLKDKQLPGLDQGVSALLATLEERGLLESTTVMVSGEFGRTPKINKNTGRDHWPRAMFMLLAGGGIAPGRLIGGSDDQGMGPDDRTAIMPDDVAATVFHSLGIDHTVEYYTPTGRPVMIVREGEPIEELLA